MLLRRVEEHKDRVKLHAQVDAEENLRGSVVII
jgi:hypothetical protein